MKQIKLTKANLEKLVANPPSKRDEYRTDIGGCYLRVGPSSMSISVLRRDSKKKQVRVSIPIDTLDLPNLPALKRLIRQAKESESHSIRMSTRRPKNSSDEKPRTRLRLRNL